VRQIIFLGKFFFSYLGAFLEVHHIHLHNVVSNQKGSEKRLISTGHPKN
jgi:hypothetical protein